MTVIGSESRTYSQLESPDAYKAFYDEQGKHCGNHHLNEDFPRAKFIIERLKPGMRVLEMGCQTGGITRLIAPHVKEVVANELSDTYRERAREILANNPNVDLIDGFAEDLWDRELGEFDVVIAMELLEHVLSPSALCETAYLLTKDEGMVLLSVPKNYEDPIGEHVREFTEASFHELLHEHFETATIVDAGEWYLAEARL